ncbi:MAG: hypothetical protein ACQEP8_06395 [Chlamydiota bacterium]
MNYLKAAIVTTFVVASVLLVLLLFVFDGDYRLKKAQDAFQQEEYTLSLTQLEKIKTSITSHQYYLGRAYLYRIDNNLPKSSQALETALAAAYKNNLPHSQVAELYLNLALNAYLSHDSNNLGEYVASLSSLYPDEGYVHLLQGLNYYYKHNYLAALNEWQNLPPFTTYSPWMAKIFPEIFDEQWQNYHIARCYLEQDKFFEARQLLKKHYPPTDSKDLEEYYYLLGLSYLLQADNQPFSTALLCYQHADHSARKDSLASRYYRAAQEAYDALDFESFFLFAERLESWQATTEIQLLGGMLARDLRINPEHISIFTNHLKTNLLQEALSEELLEDLCQQLAEGQKHQALSSWNLTLQIAPQPSSLTEKLNKRLPNMLVEAIAADNEDLPIANIMMDFYQDVSESPMLLRDFSDQFLRLSEVLWQRPFQAKKSSSLLKLSGKLSPSSLQESFLNTVTQVINTRFQQALADDDIDKLGALYDAIKHFNFDIHDFLGKNELANQLGDAAYYFKSKCYKEAQKRARWILNIEPYNRQAAYIAGTVSYYHEDFKDALQQLSKVSNPDKRSQEAIAICQIYNDTPQAGRQLLKSLAQSCRLSDHAYLLLGYLSQLEGNPEESLQWFNNIRRPGNEVYINLCYSAYQLNNWQAALQHYNKIAAPHEQLPSLKAIAAHSLAALGDIDAAREMVFNTHSDSSELAVRGFSKWFEKFNEKQLKRKNFNFFAAIFCQEFLHDNLQALQFLDKVEIASSQVLIKKSEILLNMKRHEEALQVLTQAQQLSKDPSSIAHVKLIRGKALLENQRREEALQELNAAVTLTPHNKEALKALYECLQCNTTKDNPHAMPLQMPFNMRGSSPIS